MARISLKTRIGAVCTVLLLVSAQLFAPISALVPSASAAAICNNDSAGANDVSGQKDLTRMCVDYANAPATIQTTWNWDELGTTGANTMDACNLFDTDGDGNANYAVCVSTQNTPATFKTLTTYSCGDARDDRCTSTNTVISNGSTTCTVSQQNTDPFSADDAYPADTQGQCTISLSAVGGSTAKLIDVCSYPSGQPNSDPSDCVIARSNSAKVEVLKSLSPSTDSGRFDLKIGGTTYATNIGDGGDTGQQVVTADGHTSLTILEQANSTTNATDLSNYSTGVVCKDQHGTGSTIASGSPTGSLTRQLSFTPTDGQDIICTFTNTRATGTITVTKQVVNDNGGTAQVSDFPLYVNQTQVTSGASNSYNSGASYTVSENGGPSGYAQTGLTCTDTSTQTSLGATFTLGANQNVSCVITNDDLAGKLIVKKIVVNDNGGTKSASDFSFKVNGGTAQSFDASGENDLAVSAGTYSVAETADSGYATTYDNCSNLVIANGGSATCTITNDDIAPSLTLNKIVSNTHGGTAHASDWTLTASGPSTLSGPGVDNSDSDVVSGSTFKAGTYTLSESGTTAGYAASAWTCTNNVTVANNQITLANGQSTTCSITNSDVAPILTVIKNVVNQYGTPLPATSFPLYVDGSSVTTNVPTTNFNAGSHTVTETQQPGYSFSGVSGDCSYDAQTDIISILLSLGQSSTCTITNTAIQPELIVKKHVVNNNGGTKSASDFTMTVSGTDVSQSSFTGSESGTTVYLSEGSYSVDELADSGYSKSLSGDCSGTIAVGDVKTCTITNDDIAPTLTVIKHVVNDYKGSKTAADFTMNVDGTNVSDSSFAGSESGTTVTLDAGSYTVSESGPSGYTSDYSSDCTGTIVAGEQKTCTITNTAQPATLIVKKIVSNPYGGTKSASDFSFSVNGGATQSFDVSGTNALTVDAGTYTVTEPDYAGYGASFDNCSDVVIGNGETATCTITNTDLPAKLTIVKSASPSTAQSFSFTSDQLGAFSLTGDNTATSLKVFDDLNVGEYTFTEQPSNHWYTLYISCDNDTYSYSDSMTVSLGLGDNVTCYVQNVELNTISGNKFEDVNMNGSWDNGEPALQGWTINLYQPCVDEPVALDSVLNCDVTPAATTVTDKDGAYSFTDLYPGEYQVCEVQQDGWIQTYPADNNGCHEFYIEGDGQTMGNVNFGNFKKGEITGVKFNDVNGNGKHDAGEPNLKNWEITLTKLCVVTGQNLTNITACQDTVVGKALTDATGAYSFTNLDPGTYTVCETMQDKWEQTYPATKDGCYQIIIATSGQVITADFGNHPKPQVLGELVNTGDNASVNILIGLAILGALGGLHLMTRRQVRAN